MGDGIIISSMPNHHSLGEEHESSGDSQRLPSSLNVLAYEQTH